MKLMTIISLILMAGCGSKIWHEQKPADEKTCEAVPEEKILTAPSICVDIEILKKDGTIYTGCSVAPEDGKKFTVIDVSSTTCGACIENFPIWAEFVKEIEEVATVRTILIDRKKKAILDYVAAHPDWFQEEVGLDIAMDQSEVLKLRYTPTMFVIDETGTIVYRSVGVLTKKNKADIKACLGL